MDAWGSSETLVADLGDNDAIDAVEELAVELETFAFERERVLAKLDIRGATSARRTARELRLVVTRAAHIADPSKREEMSSSLGELLGRAHTLLEGEPAVPSIRGEGDPPMPSSQAAKSMSPPTSDVRKITRAPLEMDVDPDLPAVLGINQRETARAMPAVTVEPEQEILPFFGGDEGDNDFDDETVARKVVWERSSNRIFGR